MWLGIVAVDPDGEHNDAALQLASGETAKVQLNSTVNPLGGGNGRALPSTHSCDPSTGVWKAVEQVLRVEDEAVPPSLDEDPDDPFSIDRRHAAGWRFLAEYRSQMGMSLPPQDQSVEYADRWSFAPRGGSIPENPSGWIGICDVYKEPVPVDEEFCEDDLPEGEGGPEPAAASGQAADETADGKETAPAGEKIKPPPRYGWTAPLSEPPTTLISSYCEQESLPEPGDGYDMLEAAVLGWAWHTAIQGVYIDPFGDKSQLGRGCFFLSKALGEEEKEEAIKKGKKVPPGIREIRGPGWQGNGEEMAPHYIDLSLSESYHNKLHPTAEENATTEKVEGWSLSWEEYFAPEIERDVVQKLRAAMPEAVVSREVVQKVLFVADYDTAKAAELLITDPTVVLDWKITTVVLEVKKVLTYAQPYVNEFASAFEASGGEVLGAVDILLNDPVVLRRNCEAEVRSRMKRCRKTGECFGHYAIALPNKNELSKALDAASPDTNAVVERLNHMPSIQERETKGQRAVMRSDFEEALLSMANDGQRWSDGNENTDGKCPLQYSHEMLSREDYNPALESSGALNLIEAHSMIDKFFTQRRSLVENIKEKCLEKACSEMCSDPAIVAREMRIHCEGKNSIFPFSHAVPSEKDIKDVYIKASPSGGLDLRDMNAKHKLATAMAMALWKVPELVKCEVLGETRPRFEFTTPTEEEFSGMYDKVCLKIPGRNEIGTTAAAIDKGLMKLEHIGPPETRGRLLKLKYGEVRSQLRAKSVIDYSDSNWTARNPTWEEFKSVFEGPGADNVDRTAEVCAELETVVERERQAKEDHFWGWLVEASRHHIKQEPHYVLHYKVERSVIQRVFGSVAGVEGSGIPTLESCLASMPPYAEYPNVRFGAVEIKSEVLTKLMPIWASSLAQDEEVMSGEGEERAKVFWSAFKEHSETWTKKTGRKYYVEERPKYEEILEVMKVAVETGIHENSSAVVETYYSHRRASFVKYFTEMAAARSAGDADAEYKYEMSVTTTGWWDVSMPFQAVLVCGIACLEGKPFGPNPKGGSDPACEAIGYAGMMVESIGQSYTGTAQAPTMQDGSFQIMAQHSSVIHLKVITEFAEEVFGPYTTEEAGAMMSAGRVHLVKPENAWPTVLQKKRCD